MRGCVPLLPVLHASSLAADVMGSQLLKWCTVCTLV